MHLCHNANSGRFGVGWRMDAETFDQSVTDDGDQNVIDATT